MCIFNKLLFLQKKYIMITEAFLHYLWKNRLFQFLNVYTTDGLPLSIVSTGYHNSDAGPDFKQAVIRIDDMLWAGDVEIHIRSSDWYRHHHQEDEKYRSVVLHVVYEHDMEIQHSQTENYPTLELKNLIPHDIYQQYERLRSSPDQIACSSWLNDMSSLQLNSLISEMTMERLLRKQRHVLEVVAQCHDDWNEGLYRHVAAGFGFKTNASVFEMLAQSLPYKIISHHSDSKLQIAALVFGQAGMLSQPIEDEYFIALKYEYDYLRYKYGLSPIETYHWNLLRLRPCNFPCVRLSQFAAFLYKFPNLRGYLLESVDTKTMFRQFAVKADDYWQYHYHFGKKNMLPHSVTLGSSAISLLMINTVIPFLFAFHKFSGQDHLLEGDVAMLSELPFEDNKLTRMFSDSPFPKQNAMDSQALIELQTHYCQPKKCLDCAIGTYVLRQLHSPEPDLNG